jgi:hypothetical protein
LEGNVWADLSQEIEDMFASHAGASWDEQADALVLAQAFSRKKTTCAKCRTNAAQPQSYLCAECSAHSQKVDRLRRADRTRQRRQRLRRAEGVRAYRCGRCGDTGHNQRACKRPCPQIDLNGLRVEAQ